MKNKINELKQSKITYGKFVESFNGWHAYAKWANANNLVENLVKNLA